jgi:hypothetical protein
MTQFLILLELMFYLSYFSYSFCQISPFVFPNYQIMPFILPNQNSVIYESVHSYDSMFWQVIFANVNLLARIDDSDSSFDSNLFIFDQRVISLIHLTFVVQNMQNIPYFSLVSFFIYDLKSSYISQFSTLFCQLLHFYLYLNIRSSL